MIRTCNGCKALTSGRNYSCALGHAITTVKVILGVPVHFRPTSGICEKPKTNSEFSTAIRLKDLRPDFSSDEFNKQAERDILRSGMIGPRDRI